MHHRQHGSTKPAMTLADRAAGLLGDGPLLGIGACLAHCKAAVSHLAVGPSIVWMGLRVSRTGLFRQLMPNVAICCLFLASPANHATV